MAGKPERTSPTNKDVSLLQQLHKTNQLQLAPEFQRLGVWPRPAKAYLLDTILSDRPIPLLFFSKTVNPQTSRPSYAVVDGQQRLRAIFEFLDDRFRLPSSEATNQVWRGKRFSKLERDEREQILNYDLSVVELKNYSEHDIRDIFIRMNKYVVKLNPAELRHAYEDGAFKSFVEELARLSIWRDARILTPTQINRMRSVEFAAELVLLLSEGPQDKKDSVNLYYEEYAEDFEPKEEIELRLNRYLSWVQAALPDFSSSRWRKPVDLYALLGALDELTDQAESLTDLDADIAGAELIRFEERLNSKSPDRLAARYLVAAGRQTDNIQPRSTRIAILKQLLSGVKLGADVLD